MIEKTLPILLLALFLAPSAAGQFSATPEQMHVTLGEKPGTLVVHYAVLGQTHAAVESPTITWQGGSAPARLVGTIQMGSVSIRTTGYYETYVYAATIGPFEPGTEITYRVGNTPRGSSAPRTVQMPPAADQPLRFVAYGDIGLDATAGDGGKMAGRTAYPAHEIRDLTIAQDPDLFLIAGDLPYNNARDGWDAYMRFSDPLQSTVPTMPVLGNHEWDGTLGYAQFLNTYVLPGDEKNFVYQAGPATFIGINSDEICGRHARGGTGTAPRPCDPNSGEQVNQALVAWVEGALQQATTDETPWTIVYHHHPPYSWGDHGSDWAAQTLLAPLYTKYGVDLVVTAHDHMYSRSHPVVDNRPLANATTYAKGTAPVYVVAGGGGRSLYELRAGPWPGWLAHAEKVHHLIRVDLTTSQLNFTALRHDGSTMDAFMIAADAAPAETSAKSSPLPPLLCLLALAYAVRRTRNS